MCVCVRRGGGGQSDSSRLCSNMAVMELIDHLYGRLLAPTGFSIQHIPNPPVSASLLPSLSQKTHRSPVDFNLATVLTLAAGFTQALRLLCFPVLFLFPQEKKRAACSPSLLSYRKRLNRKTTSATASVAKSCFFPFELKGRNQSMITFAHLFPLPPLSHRVITLIYLGC